MPKRNKTNALITLDQFEWNGIPKPKIESTRSIYLAWHGSSNVKKNDIQTFFQTLWDTIEKDQTLKRLVKKDKMKFLVEESPLRISLIFIRQNQEGEYKTLMYQGWNEVRNGIIRAYSLLEPENKKDKISNQQKNIPTRKTKRKNNRLEDDQSDRNQVEKFAPRKKTRYTLRNTVETSLFSQLTFSANKNANRIDISVKPGNEHEITVAQITDLMNYLIEVVREQFSSSESSKIFQTFQSLKSKIEFTYKGKPVCFLQNTLSLNNTEWNEVLEKIKIVAAAAVEEKADEEIKESNHSHAYIISRLNTSDSLTNDNNNNTNSDESSFNPDDFLNLDSELFLKNPENPVSFKQSFSSAKKLAKVGTVDFPDNQSDEEQSINETEKINYESI